jgi:VCBS repeat-containing protein
MTLRYAIMTILLLISVSYASSAYALNLSFTQVSTPFNTPIGIDHFEGTPDKVVISVNYPSGSPRNFELVAADGTRTPFSTISGFTDEVKIATARADGVNSFTPGTLFTGNGIDGQIAKINPDGTFVNPWVDLPGLGNGLMRGSLYVDRTGIFNGDLIAVTTGGEVWRIDSSGTPTKLADVNVHLEGVMTVPNDSKFGALAGKIIAGAEGQSRVYAIDTSGTTQFWVLSFQIEDIDLIPANENFFGVNFGTGKLLGVSASAFDTVEGEILVTDEFPNSGSGLGLLKWNSATNTPFVETIGIQLPSAPVAQWEHVTFSSAGIVEIPAIEICGDGIDNDNDGLIDEGCNTAPTANDDAYSTDEDTALTVPAIGILANDSDPENDPLSAMLVSGPTNAQSFTLNSDGSFTYTPAANYNGPDSFTYKVNDGALDSNTATVNITVNPVNDPPIAVNDAVTTDEDVSVTVNVLANDSDVEGPVTVTSTTSPTNGMATINLDGTITYTPNANINGVDTFMYTITDSDGATATAEVTITIIAVNDAPECGVATPNTPFLWPPNHKMVSIGFAMPTSDVDGDTVTLSITSIFQDEPTNGLGDGDTSPDATLSPAQVRAERQGTGDGRVYVVTVLASDGNDGSCTGTFAIGVPHDQKKPITAVNSGTTYDSTTP